MSLQLLIRNKLLYLNCCWKLHFQLDSANLKLWFTSCYGQKLTKKLLLQFCGKVLEIQYWKTCICINLFHCKKVYRVAKLFIFLHQLCSSEIQTDAETNITETICKIRKMLQYFTITFLVEILLLSQKNLMHFREKTVKDCWNISQWK